ncbi:MAG TPA: protein translocase subunit SecD [Coriobacteriia bacterium]|jgi:preprotein translocase subunit SecD/SecD/SecF fusion protein
MDQKQQNVLALGLALVLLAVAVWQFMPLSTKIRKGLDLQGGLSVILTAKPTAKSPVNDQAMARAELIVRNRVDRLGVSEASVQRQGTNSILVQLPGIRDPEGAIKLIGSTGQLQFVKWDSIPATQQAAWDAYMQQLDQGATPKQPAAIEATGGAVILNGSVVQNAQVSVDTQTNQTGVEMTFDDRGTQEWAQFTSGNVGKRVAIVLDGAVQSAPQIKTAIVDGRSEITGRFTAEQAKRLATVLQTGALPVSLEFSSSEVVGPTLGAESLQRGLFAAIVGLGLVALYMAVYYRGLGVLTWLSLGAFTTLFLGVIAVMSYFGTYALSLPGLAGMVLTIGLAADTSILILERFKEEVRQGKTYRTAARSGSRHAIGTSIDADLVTFVSAIFLFFVAIGPVKGFALTLMIGIVCDLTIGILFTRSILMMLSESVIEKAPALFGMKGGDRRG